MPNARRPIFALSTLAIACSAAAPSRAQDATPPAAAASAARPFALDTVVITATKRREDARKVPLAVSVLSGEALQDNHINDLSDLTRSVPNLSFSSQGGAGLSTLAMRGVSSQAGSATVSVYLDDVSLTTRNLYSQGSAEPRFFDIDRVEVLRGPQGTLYGASSLGGTIKFVSRQPDAKAFSGSAYGELSSTAHGGTNYLAQAVVNVPLSKDSVGLRIGVQTGHDSGTVDQVSPTTLKLVNKDINGTRWDVVKLALKAELPSGWSLTPAIFHQRFRSNDIDTAYLAVGGYQLPEGATPPALGLLQTSKTVREPATDTLSVPSLTLQGDLGFAAFTGVLSGFNRRFNRVQDGTSVNVPYIASVVADPALSATVGALPSAVLLNNKTSQTSLELRLASKDLDLSRNPFTWVGGLYLAKTKTEVYDDEPVYGINAAFTAAGRNINDPNELTDSFAGAFTGDSSYYSARHYLDKQVSLFGELTYHVSETLRAGVGVRVLRATQHFTREGSYYYTFNPLPSTALIDSSANATTPRLTLSWDATPATTVYGNVAKGFRLGAANRPIPLSEPVTNDLKLLQLSGTIPASFEPDSLWSYELGTKSQLLDKRLSLNVALFHIDWKNIQQDVVLPSSGFDFETNVGRATVNGIEFESRLRATEALTLTAAASYVHAVFADNQPELGSSGGVLNVQKGDPIQGVPKYSARLGFEYRFPAVGGDAFVRASGQWTGSSHGSFVRSSTDYLRPGYFTADAAAGLSLDRWQFSVFAKNLTDNGKIIQQPAIQNVSQALYLRPRTVGVTVAYDF